ncbi:hypothetical protein [Sphingomonas sp. MMS24-J13]|uniref:hypothetical protein n=1 Tax=Sphingomonas sp. MMS24-J13 TaxID=3238686 RepID=UPI00384AAC48
MMRNLFIPAALSGLLLLPACGPEVNAPSLAPRAIEKQPIDLPATEGEPKTPVDPALAGRIAPLVAAAQAGDRAFARQRAETEAAIAKAAGTAPGGEAWIVAQQSLSLLDAARAPVRDAVASIEAIRSEPANAASGNRAAIEAAASTIETIDDAEASVVAALGAKLGG